VCHFISDSLASNIQVLGSQGVTAANPHLYKNTWSIELYNGIAFVSPYIGIHLDQSKLLRHVTILSEEDVGLLLTEVEVFGNGNFL